MSADNQSLDYAWESFLPSVRSRRHRDARFYKPTCLFAVTQLLDDGHVTPERIPLDAVLDRFSSLVSAVFPHAADRGWAPFWHLSRDGAWTCYRGPRAVVRADFRQGKPDSLRTSRAKIEFAAVPVSVQHDWSSPAARLALRQHTLRMMLGDEDPASQAMGEYLRSRFETDPLDGLADFSLDSSADAPSTLLLEDYSRLRAHVRIERSETIIRAVKKLRGSTCEACGFNYEAAYGPLGRGFIEAHHLVSVASRKGTRQVVDIRSDFIVLCANCHRMIHRAGLPQRLELFKATCLVPGKP